MTTYVLPFDPTGRHPERITVPAGKVLYLTRAPQSDRGTATVTDLISMRNYVMADRVTMCLTTIPPNEEVALAFMSRQSNDVLFVNAEVITRRQPDFPCAQNAQTEEEQMVAGDREDVSAT